MPRNVEIKARLRDADATRRLVAAVADGPPTTLEQADTFFRVAAGRLKLRELADGTAELIHYERRDTTAPADSRYAKCAVPDAGALRELLAAALGVRGRVVKRRLLFRVGRTRVHLDDVEGLGAFLELEVEMAEGESEAAGAAEARRLMRRFGIPEDALVAEAYVDLLERSGRGPAATRPGISHDS
ncbi:MAG: class IV adenylate cyclase [Gemmatimonadales bacterium]|jgi:predicted adenylyl cyclase CyaB